MLRSTLLYISTLAFVFLIPFFSLPLSGWDADTSKVLLASVWGLVAVVVGTLYAFADKTWRSPFKVTVVGLTSVVALLLLLASAFFSEVPRISFFGDGHAIGVPLFLVFAMGVGYATSRFASDGRRTGAVFLAVFGGIAAAMVIAFLTMLVRKFIGLSDTTTSYLFGLVGKWNDVGVYATVLLIASLLAIKRFALSGIGAVIAYVVLAISVVMLATVNLILVWTSLFFISLILIVQSLRKDAEMDMQRKKFVWIMGVLAVISLAFALDNHFGLLRGNASGLATQVFNVSSIEAYPSVTSTMSVVKGALSESPLFGFGPGRFADAWRLYRPQGVNLSQFWATDFTYGVGLWPTFLITGGLFGFIGILALILAVLVCAVRLYRKSSGAGIAGYINHTTSLVVMFLTVMFFVYSPGWAGAMVYAALIGILVGLNYKSETSNVFELKALSKSNFVGLGALIIVVALIGGSLWIQATKVYANYHYNKAVITPAVDQGALFSISDHLQKAFTADHRDVYARSLGTAYYAQFNALLVGSSTAYTSEEFQNMLNAVINISSNAVVANPYNSQNYIFVGELFRSLDAQGVSGASEQANQFYTNAAMYEPYNPLIRVLQARLAFQDDDTLTARTKLQEAIALKGNYTEAVFLLSQLMVEEDGAQEAIAQLEARAQLTPVEPIVFFQLGFLKYAEKDYQGAIQALENAVVLVPEYSNALYFLGLSYYYEDMDDQAIAAFERIIYLNPESQDAKDVLANMREGRAPFGSVSQAPEEQDELPIEEDDETEEE